MTNKSPFEFLVFSDLHAHNHAYGATRVAVPGLKGLYNSRLADAVQVLDDILDYAKHQQIQHVVFCGDLFHSRTAITTDVRYIILDRLHMFDDESIHLYMIPGNHDMGDRKGYVHSLFGIGEFSDYIHVYSEANIFNLKEDINFAFVPYTDRLEETKFNLETIGRMSEMSAFPSILFAHLGMQGAKVGSDYVLISESDISVSDVPYNKFAACFFGHFHEHQQLFVNGWFVGATHQHNWGDAYGARGFLHVKVDKEKVSFEKINTMAPEFIITRDGKTKDGELSIMKANDFVRNITKDKFLDKDKLRDKWGVEHLEVIIESEDEDIEFVLDTAQLSPMAILDEWVDKKLPDNLNKEEVLLIGKNILKEMNL